MSQRRLSSIRSRLRRLVAVSVGLALGCSALLSVWQAAHSYLQDRREALLATANVIAGASSRAVAAGDMRLIKDSLRAVAPLRSIDYGRIENPDGRILAETGGAVRLSDEAEVQRNDTDSVWELLRTRTIQVSTPVVYAGREVGRLLLVGRADELLQRFVNVLAIAALGAGLALGVGVAIAHRLQKSISGPIGSLAAAMGRITETHDYTLSVPPASDVETERLSESFNAMMDEIGRYSAALSGREAELIFRLSRATEKRDNETGAHIVRMATLCRFVAEGLGLPKDEVEALHRVAPLHDVGKIAVPDSIMFKAGRLDPDERREMETHTTYGYEILRDSESELLRLAAEVAYSHHEWWNGNGYPRGLKGAGIPLAGRIAAVADVTDALASSRPYKRAWSLEEVRAFLVENSGKQFDPACVDALLGRWGDVERLYADPEAGSATEAPWAA